MMMFQAQAQAQAPVDNADSYTTDNMIKGNFKKTILRRDSDNTSFRPAPPLVQTNSDASIPISELASIKKTRTKDDENFMLNTPVVVDTPPLPKMSRRNTQPEVLDTPYELSPSIRSKAHSFVEPTNPSSNVDDFIDRLNIGTIGDIVKQILSIVWTRIQHSKYINSENDGRLHLQSFCIGIIMTSIVVMVQPYLVVYLDSWIILLGRLLKHLMAWVLVAVVLSYAFSTSKKEDMVENSVRTNNFDKGIKSNYSSRSASPTKSIRSKKSTNSTRDRHNQQQLTKQIQSLSGLPPRRNSEFGANNDAQLLMNITEQAQDEEFLRLEHTGFPVSYDQPNNGDNYQEFMKVAIAKDNEHQKYSKFVDDNRTNIRQMAKA